jgi:uncharacterized damage-inducible protein DinB
MSSSILTDAFEHHVWATLQLIDQCGSLTDEQLATPVPGTYGSIIDMHRHIAGADAWYLYVLTGGRSQRIDEDEMSLDKLREVMVEHEREWLTLLADGPAPEEEVVVHREDGTDSHAPLSVRLAQALHHGSDHRSQICTGLTALGIEPPDIDVWAYGALDGRVFETT